MGVSHFFFCGTCIVKLGKPPQRQRWAWAHSTPTDVSLVRVPALALHPTQFDADNGWNRCQEAVGLYCQISNHSVRDFPRYWHNITYFLLVLSHSADCLSVASLFLLKGLPGNDASLYTLLQLYTLNTVEPLLNFYLFPVSYEVKTHILLSQSHTSTSTPRQFIVS